MIIKEEQRDRAQEECWSRTFRATREAYGWNDITIAEFLLGMSNERLMEKFRIYAPHWAKILEENGGIR